MEDQRCVKSDTLLFAGFALIFLFGSALDSEGLGLWLAAAGVLAGIALIFLSVREAERREAVGRDHLALGEAFRKGPVGHQQVAAHTRPGQASKDVLGSPRPLGLRNRDLA